MNDFLKVLVIGFGSIGKRHISVLKEIDPFCSIDVVSKQSKIFYTTYKSLKEVPFLNTYDYYIIASETYKHFEQLSFLDDHVKNKLICCEKPLFEKKRDLQIKNNQVFVGYNLRFHPLIMKLKNELSNQKILSLNILCGSYLPHWRQNSDYRECYSAKKELGGGVLLDLSHEIDYMQWLFAKPIMVSSVQKKVSELDIDSDDLVMAIGQTENNVMFNFSLDYFSKISKREIVVHTNKYTYQIDLIRNSYLKRNIDGEKQDYTAEHFSRNTTFKRMHLDILNSEGCACTFEEGIEVMDTISVIQEQNR